MTKPFGTDIPSSTSAGLRTVELLDEASRLLQIERLRNASLNALNVLEQLQGGCTDSDDGTVEAITVWCPEISDELRAALENTNAK